MRKTHKIPFRTAAPSKADPGRHVAWRALGLGVKDLPLLVRQVTFMAHSCVDAVKQSAQRPVGRRLVELLADGGQTGRFQANFRVARHPLRIQKE